MNEIYTYINICKRTLNSHFEINIPLCIFFCIDVKKILLLRGFVAFWRHFFINVNPPHRHLWMFCASLSFYDIYDVSCYGQQNKFWCWKRKSDKFGLIDILKVWGIFLLWLNFEKIFYVYLVAGFFFPMSFIWCCCLIFYEGEKKLWQLICNSYPLKFIWGYDFIVIWSTV